MRPLAREIALELFNDLKANKIKAISINTVNDYIRNNREAMKHKYDKFYLQMLVCRMVVEMVG